MPGPCEYFSDFTIKWTTSRWEVESARALRRQVFCEEQRLFEDSDADDSDTHAQLIVALANHGGWHDRVVGTVRIHQQAEGVWWGSRLALTGNFRGQARLASALIKLAVSSARGLGCREFYATVQTQNEVLFRRLHWQSLRSVQLSGRTHILMQAQLDYYPPCLQPCSGYVLAGARSRNEKEIMPLLLHSCAQQSNGREQHHVA